MKIELSSLRIGKTSEYLAEIGRQVVQASLSAPMEFMISGPKGAFRVKVTKLRVPKRGATGDVI